MNCEVIGIGAPTLGLAGCLGKHDEEKASPGNCPWCSAKGQTSALRFYAISLKETMLLCTRPECLYPLVSRSLEDVRASLSKVGCKRKMSAILDVSVGSSPPKQAREEMLHAHSVVSELCATEVIDNCHPNDRENTNTCTEKQSMITETIANDAEEQGLPAAPLEEVEMCVSSTQDEVKEAVAEDSSELVPLQPHLFWDNQDNLCWLDSLMVMLVHCRTIRETPCGSVKLSDEAASEHHSDSEVWKFCLAYEKTCAFLKAKEQQCEDEVSKVSAAVLDEANQRLLELRMSLFKLLQPTLKCELGQKETPVFALPLLLRTDRWAEDLFKHTIRWEFKCTSCEYTVNDSTEKTLTTLTQIYHDWHPLKALQHTQCNNCFRKNQKRKMVIEKLSPVFALHFVEGLSRKDLAKYQFDFQGLHYKVTAVIQYKKELEHFVTWIRQSNWLWMEVDDLKHPVSYKHKRFSFPAKEFHILFWEADSVKNEDSKVCSLPAPAVARNPVESNENSNTLSDSIADDSCVLSALTVADSSPPNNLNSSIGSTTLLDTFEGLSHKDIVTLALVEPESSSKVFQSSRDATPATSRDTSSDGTMTAGLPEDIGTLTLVDSGSRENPQNVGELTSVNQEPSSLDTFKDLPPEEIVTLTLVATESSEGPQVPQTPIAFTVQPKPPVTPSLTNPYKPGYVVKPPVIPLPPTYSSVKLQQCPLYQSTPIRPPPPRQRPILKCSNNEAFPVKPAEKFGGFVTKKTPNLVNPLCQKSPEQQPITTTDALRLKLMKKLKAKKKKLAKLNQLLGTGVESAPTPDSTAISSPYSVSSSTSAVDNPEYDQFFAELLSPVTSVSNLSPDSTGFLEEMLNNGQNSEKTSASQTTVTPEATLPFAQSTKGVSPLDEYMESDMCMNAIENNDFNSLDIFF